MKKPTRKRREWNARHASSLFRRELNHKIYLKEKNRAGNHPRPNAPRMGKKGYSKSINFPRIMALAENFCGVMSVVHQIRQYSNRQRNERAYINFKQIEEISPGAALVVAAELDRLNKLVHRRNRKLIVLDAEEWNDNVRERLEGMGFFDLLDVPMRKKTKPSDGSGTRYVRFRTGEKVDGQKIEELRTLDLEHPSHDNDNNDDDNNDDDNVPNRRRLYAAVTEAMTNVVHHAYQHNARNPTPNWWLSASQNVKKGEIRILLYDQGIGIPKTLPKKFNDYIINFFKFGDPMDADLIYAAHKLNRSSSKKGHRGHGLERDVRQYVQSVDCVSAYRVTSLHGQYTWEKGSDGQIKESRRNYRRELPGTLIEWRLTLQ